MVPITETKTDVDLVVNPSGIKPDSGIVKWALETNRPFTNSPIFNDYAWKKDGDIILNPSQSVNYYIYLWNKSESVIGQTQDYKSNETVDDKIGGTHKELLLEYAELKNKIIANKKFSLFPIYINNPVNYWREKVSPTLFDSDQVVSKAFDF